MKRAGFPACFYLGAGRIKHLVLDMADEVMALQLAIDALADATGYPILPTFALRLRIDHKPLMLYGFNRGT